MTARFSSPRLTVALALALALCAYGASRALSFRAAEVAFTKAPKWDEVVYWDMAQQAAIGWTVVDRGGADFISFRSPVLSVAVSPVLWWLPEPKALSFVRWLGFLFAAMIPLLAACLAASLAPPGARLLAAALALAANSLLTSSIREGAAGLMLDAPALLLFLAFLALLSRPLTLRVGAAAGLAGGLAALLKFDFVYIGPLALAAAALVNRPARRGLVAAAVAWALVLGAYVARNHHHTGRAFITSKGEVNLWIGNNPDATGDYMRLDTWPHPAAFDSEHEMRAYHRTAVAEYVRSQPEHFVQGLWRKLGRLWAIVAADPVQSPVDATGARLLCLWLLLGFGLAAAALAFRSRAELAPLLPAAVATLSASALLVLVFVQPRLALAPITLAATLPAPVLAGLIMRRSARP